tara:strand:+ start:1300 stop:1509 length:210 start_codon:yes stop_codon:yes gene_type:complete
MSFIKVHRAIIEESEIEAVEWNTVSNERPDDRGDELYQIQFHMRSGKKFTRRVYEPQLQEILDTLEMRE